MLNHRDLESNFFLKNGNLRSFPIPRIRVEMFTEANWVKSEWFFAMGHKLKQNSITNEFCLPIGIDILQPILSYTVFVLWIINTYSHTVLIHYPPCPTLPQVSQMPVLSHNSFPASKTLLPSNRTLSSCETKPWKTRYWTSGNHVTNPYNSWWGFLNFKHGWVSTSYNIHFSIQYLYLWWDSPLPPKKLDSVDFRMTHFQFSRHKGCLSSCQWAHSRHDISRYGKKICPPDSRTDYVVLKPPLDGTT